MRNKINLIRSLVLTSLILLQANLSGAQIDVTCQSEPIDSTTFFNWPYFNNNQYLLNLLDSVEGTPIAQVLPNSIRIPVTAWVYHSVDISDNVRDNTVEAYINVINQFLRSNSSRIRLYLRCNVIHQINTVYYNNVGGSNYNQMFNSNHVARTLNIHFVNGTADNLARGRFPWRSQPFAAYIPTFFSRVGNSVWSQSANTLIHEIGHTMGLSHTHEGSRGNRSNNGDCGDCYQESVSRTRTQGAICVSTFGNKKCEVNGDALCDTDADPNLQVTNGTTTTVYVASDCSAYLRTGPYLSDRWGSPWLPAGNDNAIRNIMSYSLRQCRTNITPMQRAVQYYYALYRNGFTPQFESFYRNDNIDAFENDNFPENANLITLGEVQARAFHLVPDQNSNYTGCDVDWIRFTPVCTGNLNVETSTISGKPNANTRITIFNAITMTQLAQNDDVSAGNLFSRITFNFTASTSYLIRVENMTPNVAGHYSFAINQMQMGGNAQNCSPTTFSVTNVPTGALVTWSVSPAIGTFSPSMSATTTFTPNGSGTAIISAQVSGCGISQTLSRTVTIGVPPPTLNVSLNCPEATAFASNAVGATSYTWSIDTQSGLFTYTNQPSTRTFKNITLDATICVRYINSCGISLPTCQTVFCPSGSGQRLELTPNPASSSVEFKVINQNVKVETNVIALKTSAIIISSQDGIVLLRSKFDASWTKRIDLAKFQSGIYFVTAFDGSEWMTKRLVILK